jgi:hypothetical protein
LYLYAFIPQHIFCEIQTACDKLIEGKRLCECLLILLKIFFPYSIWSSTFKPEWFGERSVARELILQGLERRRGSSELPDWSIADARGWVEKRRVLFSVSGVKGLAISCSQAAKQSRF